MSATGANAAQAGDSAPRSRAIAPAAAAAVIVAIDAVIAFALVGVGGDFPLSDDWSYAHAARELCERGRFDFLPWTGASLVAQAFYGSVVCRVFGFSFTALRISTLVLGAIADLGVLQLVRTLGYSTRLALFAALAFALSPLRVNLGFTFMTDVPFACAAVWAAVAYARGLRDGRRSDLLLGAVLAAIALLIRQHGIFIAAAAFAVAATAGQRPARERLVDALACTVAPAAVFLAFHAWLLLWHGAPSGMENKAAEIFGLSLFGTGNVAFRAILTTGFVLAPVAVLVGRDVAATRPRRLLLAAAALSALWTFSYYRDASAFPYLPNVLRDFGVGALTLRDTLFLGLPAPDAQLARTGLLGFVNGGLIVFLAAILGGAWIGALRRPAAATAVRFALFAGALLAAGSLLHSTYYFDRYLLPVLPFAIAAAIYGVRGPHQDRVGAAAWVALALVAFYSVAGTHDYMAWNRARYAAVERLQADGATVEEIDAGMEFGGWHLAAKLDRWPTDADVKIGRAAKEKSWWWVVDDRYVVSMQPLDGYTIRDEQRYREWLVPGHGTIYVLERIE